MEHSATYPPLNTLKQIADNLWIVDGPLIRFGPAGMKMPFPTRMTVIRLAGDALFIHSPTPLIPELAVEIESVGRPRFVIGPSRIHYWWIPEWKLAYPDVQVWLAPHIREQAGGRIDFPCLELERETGYPWDEEIATLPVSGAYLTEVEFFHFASWTLVLTDLIENFEPEKLSLPVRLLAWLGGVLDPHGSTPRDMRLTFRKNQAQVKAAVEKMISWDPERVILAHGRWYEANGADELRRAFRWLLD